jgi:hypothetical protein
MVGDMLFPNVSTEEWIDVHKGLRVTSGICKCGQRLLSNVPFVTRDYVGLTSPVCNCGSRETKVESAIPRTAEEKKSWDSALGYL